VAAQTAGAPVTSSAREIDFADNAATDETWITGGNHFTDEFVSGSAREFVIATQEFQIGIADASREEANHRIAFATTRFCHVSYRCSPSFKVNRNHSG
jgi:hypothetical protein